MIIENTTCFLNAVKSSSNCMKKFQYFHLFLNHKRQSDVRNAAARIAITPTRPYTTSELSETPKIETK